ncbi:HTH-type transcriptional regulator CueR [Oxobacter pfennigii]|uniref:HTH-type transcriptional regulator CueR n=1 Tax=Oxobacter pfennigii TaxID=36849 RepID=A0A0N8NTC6_9CLOT|nr:MerR family DNA-binding transcriptional regulator [Oxobacter pfennigii]KPU44456.1 HTH-type transcriptional regulator CueR [Oxobacter pfennigii]
MAIRPVDIARRLNVSTTTLRVYEDMGLAPKPNRTSAGYREYTEEHAAYFVCVREMLPAFDLTFIKSVLKKVQNKDIDTAFQLLNGAQADLWNDRQIAKKFSGMLTDRRSVPASKNNMMIKEVSKETGIPVTTIRFWEKAGLILPLRNPANGYRFYNGMHIKQLLTLYAIKLSVKTHRGKHFISAMEEAYRNFDISSLEQIHIVIENINARINKINRLQMKAAAALYSLCQQVESGRFQAFC